MLDAGDGERNSVRRLYWWALVVRAVVGITGFFATAYTDLAVLEDSLFYEQLGHAVASDWLDGKSADWLDGYVQGGDHARFMALSIGVAYFLMGGIRAVPVLLILCSAVTALSTIYVYWITRELDGSPQAARIAAWLVALSPVFMVTGGGLYKEGLIHLALAMSVYHTLVLQSRWQRRSIPIIIAATWVLVSARFYIGLAMAAVVAMALLAGRRRAGQSVATPAGMLRHAIVLLLFIAAMFALGFAERGERVLFESQKGLLVEIQQWRRNLQTEAYSGYLTEMDVSTPGGALLHFPVGLVYFLTVPHPWQFGRLRQNLTIPETLVWSLLYVVALIGIRRCFQVQRSGTVMLLAAIIAISSIYALVSGNIGIAYRMRSQVWLLLAPLIGVGWAVLSERRAWRDQQQSAVISARIGPVHTR